MTNEKRLQANCLRCGWYGWSDQTHICEFGKVMPAMQDMMRIAPEPDVGGTLTKILAKQQQEDKRLQALAELQAEEERMEKFGLEKESWDEANKMGSLVDFGLTCLGVDLYQKGFNKALDLVMEGVDKELGASRTSDRIEAIISKLRGEK